MTNEEAIKTLHELWRTTNDPWYEKVYEMAINALTAQPETHEKRTETHACDCIERQAAIDAFDNLEWFHQNANKDMVSGANPEHHQAWYKEQDVYKTLEQLPSVQSEIVLCKDCVKRNRKLGSLDEHYNRYNKSQCCPMIEFRGILQGHEFDYQYCSWAERRTDE